METRTFEMLYTLLETSLSQLPAVFAAFSQMPLMAQELIAVVVLAASIGIIVAIVEGVRRFWAWWQERH